MRFPCQMVRGLSRCGGRRYRIDPSYRPRCEQRNEAQLENPPMTPRAPPDHRTCPEAKLIRQLARSPCTRRSSSLPPIRIHCRSCHEGQTRWPDSCQPAPCPAGLRPEDPTHHCCRCSSPYSGQWYLRKKMESRCLLCAAYSHSDSDSSR